MNKLTIPDHWLTDVVDVTLVGLGGTGSAMLTQLFQLHGILKRLGGKGLRVTAIDGDEVSHSNVYRQNFWSHDIGKNKAEVLISRFNMFGEINWKAVPEFITGSNLHLLRCDLLITAVDKASVRYDIGVQLNKLQSQGLWLGLGNNDFNANVFIGSQAPSKTESFHVPSPFELFGTQWQSLTPTEDDTPSCSTEEAISKQTFGINNLTATSAASMLLFPLFRTGSIDFHGLYIDVRTGNISSVPVHPDQWAALGYA